MTKDDLLFFKNWFSDFCKSYYSLDSEDQKNISLKEEHTFHVCKNIIEIAGDLSLSDNEIMLAETIALFHDIGRFPQYAKYKTFKDSISVNHAFLGAETLLKEKPLQNIPQNEQQVIVRSVRFHNAFSLPRNEKKDIVFFVKLIRDADKLDIWRVFIDYYESPEEKRASAVGLGLPDTAEYSEKIISCIHRKQMASLSEAKTLDDFKLMQLSWI
ncbi:MAG: HD domain-containing protein, partial [Nitrospirota bacterium]|nr:HD domain-containing protein [Nitrospirota bacterium]